MKKISYLILFLFAFTTITFGQKTTSLERATKYLSEKGEVIFTFKATSQSQFYELSNILSFGHKHVDQKDLEVEAYANKEQFEKFLTYGLNFDVAVSDNEIPQEYTKRKTTKINGKTTSTWDTTWDSYPKYSEYVAKMEYWASTYPNLCTLQNIGTTPNGRNLYVLKISDNATVDETEPEFFYTSSMHGDEIAGYPIMLRLIDYLLTNYSTNTEVANIVNGTEIFINPLANPDGSYKSISNDIYNSSGNTPTRANANGIDLNRNYGDAIGGLHYDTKVYQPETLAFMNFEETRNFVLAANYHGGAEVFNFPWDTSYTPGTGNFSYHPHDNYFKFVSQEYASLCQTADNNLNYMDDVYNSGQFVGTTNGAAWYSVYGGRGDYNNYFNHSKESTIEVSADKTPLASSLPFYWDRNKQALLNYMKQASYGFQGVVTNTNGNPIHAKIYVSGTTDGWGSWVETSKTKGDYHKVQIAGTYSLIFEAPGYVSQTISATITNNATTTLNVTMIPTTSLPTASNDVTICEGQTTTLTATGSGTIKWYDSLNATTSVATGTSFTTPILNTTTSYFAESEVTPANVGPTTATGTATSSSTIKNKYLVFNCTTPTKLKSVLISNSVATGDILVELQNNTGTMLESKIVRLTTTGDQDIALDFFLPVATGLRLVSREISSTMKLKSITASSTTYPITSGAISITGNSGGNSFQFFNWKFEPIKSNREEVIINVNPTSVAGTVSENQTICTGSQPASITLTGSVGSIQWQSSTNNSTFTNITGETSATLAGTSIGNLAANKYFRAIVTSGVCTAATSATVSVLVPTTTWSGSWSNGSPTSATTAIIASNYSVAANLAACTLTVNNNAVVSIPSGYNITLNGALTVSSGSFTLNNNANLIQSSNVTNTGNIIVKRETSALKHLDYAMWSSPVTNASQYLKTLSPFTVDSRFYSYNPSNNLYISTTPTSTNFTSGKGYLIRMPDNHPSTPTIWTGTFTGVPNNGTITIAVANGTYNAIGNPYPSTINTDTFITTNNITEALYFWRKTNNAATTSYATYTKAGGAGTTSANSGDSNGIIPNGIIQVGQGFIAKSTATTLQFTNAMRVANNQNQFLKVKEIERNRIWLNLSNQDEPISQMMVAYMTDATEGVDPAIDGKYFNDSATALNSLINNEEYAIQGRSLPFDPSDVVPLAFKTKTSGNYSISLDHVDGFFSNSEDILLTDNVTGIETDLRTNNYLFTANEGVDNARFSIKYQKTLGVNNSDVDEDSFLVYKSTNAIQIKSGSTAIDKVKLFDISGKLLLEKTQINATELSIESSGLPKQLLIVKITLIDKKVINKKLVN